MMTKEKLMLSGKRICIDKCYAAKDVSSCMRQTANPTWIRNKRSDNEKQIPKKREKGNDVTHMY